MEGAVAFALCLNVGGPKKDIVVTSTTIIVFFSVIMFSGLMNPFASLLNIVPENAIGLVPVQLQERPSRASRKRSLNSEFKE